MFSNRFWDLYSAKKNLSQTHQNFNFVSEINPGSKRLKHICGMGELMGTVCQIQVVKIAKPALKNMDWTQIGSFLVSGSGRTNFIPMTHIGLWGSSRVCKSSKQLECFSYPDLRCIAAFCTNEH